MSPTLKKLEIQDIFIKTKYTKSTFNMIWLMAILRNCLTASHKLLCENEFDIAKNTTSIVHKFFDKKKSSGGAIKSEITSS